MVITEELVESVSRAGPGALRVLLQHPGQSFDASAKLIRRMANHGKDTLMVLLEERSDSIVITKEVVESIPLEHDECINTLLQQGRIVGLHDEIVVAVAKLGADKLEVLLKRRNFDLKVTRELVENVTRVRAKCFEGAFQKAGQYCDDY